MKKYIFAGGIIVIILAAFVYVYSPFTKTGCDNLKDRIKEQMSNASACNLASDCSFSLDSSCNFDCSSYFSKKIDEGLFSRFNRRCNSCQEKCYFESTNPVCENHKCQTTGGAVYLKTDKNEYQGSAEIKVNVANNLLTEVNYNFPITLCLRPTIMRLEKYNEQTKEWLSTGVGLLFDNDRVIFYSDPGNCQAYKIKNCTSEKAEQFIDKSTLVVKQSKTYSLPAAITTPCPADGQENLEPMSGRYRIGLYYEPQKSAGKQIYSNEFIVK